jgi:ubiquinone/menaquinone biosynthesis C-methylase UbiE
MNRVAYVKPDFPRDAFAGTATYYLRYRVPYPQALLRDLVERAGVTGQGRLLDLACGPGRVALALASSFREVWAIDLEPEMIAVGQNEATQRGVHTITWIVGKAEALQAPPASFELITIGEAFHRLDQQLVATQSLHWLQPGGCLASLGSYGVMEGKEPWQRIVADIARRWTSRARPSGGSSAQPQPGSGPEHYELVLRETGFEDVASETFVEAHTWTIETIIGNLYSTSFCSKNVLADSSDAFEADLRATLLAHDPSGTYREHMGFGYTIGRKPT